MNYCTDRPITTMEEDVLGRAPFAKRLGKSIYEYAGLESLVIGLFGKWGCGKTSVANMAIQHIKELAKEDNEPIIVKFSPWNYSDKDNLIYRFFSTLSAKINGDQKEKAKNKIGNALKDYSDAFDIVGILPSIGPLLAPILKSLGKAEGENLTQVDLDDAKEKLEEAMKEADQKIIVMIDDIDRLTNTQIRDIFQLVKQVGDLPNIIYILAMDRDVVANALSNVQDCDGNEYLEKIIQIPFEIPCLNQSALSEVFFDKLEDVIRKIDKKIQFEGDYFQQILTGCIFPYLDTLRDVNRVINVFQFRYSMLHDETSFEDMLAITTLEVLEPQLYKWVSKNQYRLCNGMGRASIWGNKNTENYKTDIRNEFEKNKINADRAIECLSVMFPTFAQNVGKGGYLYPIETNTRKQMRIAQRDRFDLYFDCDIETIKVPRKAIVECLYTLNEQELVKKISEINAQGNIVYFLDETEALIDQVTKDRLRLLISVLLKYEHTFIGVRGKFIYISVSDIARKFIDSMIRMLDTDNERYELICEATTSADVNSIGAISQIIKRIEWAYGRGEGSSSDESGQIISLEQLEKLEKVFDKRIGQMRDELISSSEFHTILYLWKIINKKSADLYVKKLLKSDVQKLKFLCRIASSWSGTEGRGWKYYPAYYSEYFNDEEVYKLITEGIEIKEYTEEELIKLASFVLNYENQDEDDWANIEKAIKKVNEWKQEAWKIKRK